MKRANKAKRHLKTITNIQLRELKRKINESQKKQYEQNPSLYKRTVNQQREDKNKIYCLHTPLTRCIAKGKAHKPYELGNKVGMITTGKKVRKIITVIKAFLNNLYDGETTEPLFEQIQIQDNELNLPKEMIYDRDGKGRKQIKGVTIITPDKLKGRDTTYQKREKRRKHRAIAAIEPIFGYLKKRFPHGTKLLVGRKGIQINAYLAATAWN